MRAGRCSCSDRSICGATVISDSPGFLHSVQRSSPNEFIQNLRRSLTNALNERRKIGQPLLLLRDASHADSPEGSNIELELKNIDEVPPITDRSSRVIWQVRKSGSF